MKRWNQHPLPITRGMKKKRNWVMFFVLGFIVGIALVYIKNEIFVKDTFFWGEDLLKKVSYTSFHSNQYFAYLFKKRFGMVLLLVLAATSLLGILILKGFVIWYGMSTGILVSVVTFRYGAKGILYFLATVIPQELVYIPAFLVLLDLLYELCNRIYFPNKTINMQSFNKKNRNMDKIIKIVFIIGLMLIGILLESYVNPFLLKRIVKLF